MDCRKFHRNLEDYLEGGLDFAGRFGMERHAQQCFGCGKVVADAQHLSQMARGLKRTGAPADFEAALLQRIQREGRAQPLWRFRRRPISFFEWPSWRLTGAFASILVVVGFAAFFSSRWLKTEQAGHAASVVAESGPPLQPQRNADALPRASKLGPTKVVAASGKEKTRIPTQDPFVRLRPGYSTEEEPAFSTEPSESDYAEYLVPGPGNRQYVMRLPKTIRMLYRQPSEEYFIRNVSH